jgi:hypothetical protein
VAGIEATITPTAPQILPATGDGSEAGGFYWATVIGGLVALAGAVLLFGGTRLRSSDD